MHIHIRSYTNSRPEYTCQHGTTHKTMKMKNEALSWAFLPSFFCLCGPSLKANQIEILILSCAGMLEREDRQKETVTEIIKSSASCRWCSEMRILFCSAGCVFVQLLLLLPLHRKTIEEMFFVLSPPPPGCGRWRWGVNSWCTRRNNASFLCLYVCLCSERE